VLDKAEYSAFQSTLNSSIVLYRKCQAQIQPCKIWQS